MFGTIFWRRKGTFDIIMPNDIIYLCYFLQLSQYEKYEDEIAKARSRRGVTYDSMLNMSDLQNFVLVNLTLGIPFL